MHIQGELETLPSDDAAWDGSAEMAPEHVFGGWKWFLLVCGENPARDGCPVPCA